MFELASGEDPSWAAGAAEGVALSYCLRVFEDAYVEAVPEVDDDDEFELLVRPGLRLSQQGVNDTCSYRLCIFPSFAPTREEAVRLARERAASLPFLLSPVTAAV
jgi:hypothetical protein